MAEPDISNGLEVGDVDVGRGWARKHSSKDTFGFEGDGALVLKGQGAQPRGARDLDWFRVTRGSGGGRRTIERVTNFRARLEGSTKRDGDRLFEEVGAHGGAPGSDANGIDRGVCVPLAELRQFVLEADGGREIFFEMFDDLFGVEIGGEIAGGIVTGMGIGHIACKNAAEAGGFHRFQAHRFSKETNLCVEADIDKMGEAVFLADRVDFSLSVRHEIVRANAQVWMHAVPTVVHSTAFASAGAATGVGRGWAGDVDDIGDSDFGESEDGFALRITDIIVDDVAGAEHDGHAKFAGGIQGFVDPGHESIDTHGGGFAPVEIPDVDSDHADFLWIDFLWFGSDSAGDGIAGLKVEGERGRSERKQESNEGGQISEGAPGGSRRIHGDGKLCADGSD